jgi:hypothetical protein
VRVQIFGKEPLPSLQEVFSYIQNEESCRSALLHPSSQTQSALVGTSQRTSIDNFRIQDSGSIAYVALDDKDIIFFFFYK